MEIGLDWMEFDEEIPDEVLEDYSLRTSCEMREKVWLYNLNKNPHCPTAALVAKYFGQDVVLKKDYKDEDGFQIYYSEYTFKDNKMKIVFKDHHDNLNVSIFIKLNGRWEQVYGCTIIYGEYYGGKVEPYIMRPGAWTGYLARKGVLAIEKERKAIVAQRARSEKEKRAKELAAARAEAKKREYEVKRYSPIDDSDLFS